MHNDILIIMWIYSKLEIMYLLSSYCTQFSMIIWNE